MSDGTNYYDNVSCKCIDAASVHIGVYCKQTISYFHQQSFSVLSNVLYLYVSEPSQAL